MNRLRARIRKVLAGIAAFLLTCLQYFGSLDMPPVPMSYGMMGYTWTEHGIRAQMLEERHQAQEEAKRQARRSLDQAAPLEGEVWEEQIRAGATRAREDKEEAAS
ncbi:MAG TPA: hypothetical protein VFV52_18065 [Bacilli bacterium]|nr:hypothetical protein [Bacilli bacterium]